MTCGRCCSRTLFRTIIKFPGVAFMRQACSHSRHGNVTVFLRGRHLFVTLGCNGQSKPPNKTMKLRQSLIDSLKRAAATVMDAAMFAGPTGFTLSNLPNYER
jgi:hypothetical protein